MKTKQQILNTVEPRSVKTIWTLNSWGSNVGDKSTPGWQCLTEDYLPNIHSTGVLYDAPEDVLNAKKTLLEQLVNLLQKLLVAIKLTQ